MALLNCLERIRDGLQQQLEGRLGSQAALELKDDAIRCHRLACQSPDVELEPLLSAATGVADVVVRLHASFKARAVSLEHAERAGCCSMAACIAADAILALEPLFHSCTPGTLRRLAAGSIHALELRLPDALPVEEGGRIWDGPWFVHLRSMLSAVQRATAGGPLAPALLELVCAPGVLSDSLVRVSEDLERHAPPADSEWSSARECVVGVLLLLFTQERFQAEARALLAAPSALLCLLRQVLAWHGELLLAPDPARPDWTASARTATALERVLPLRGVVREAAAEAAGELDAPLGPCSGTLGEVLALRALAALRQGQQTRREVRHINRTLLNVFDVHGAAEKDSAAEQGSAGQRAEEPEPQMTPELFNALAKAALVQQLLHLLQLLPCAWDTSMAAAVAAAGSAGGRRRTQPRRGPPLGRGAYAPPTPQEVVWVRKHLAGLKWSQGLYKDDTPAGREALQGVTRAAELVASGLLPPEGLFGGWGPGGACEAAARRTAPCFLKCLAAAAGALHDLSDTGGLHLLQSSRAATNLQLCTHFELANASSAFATYACRGGEWLAAGGSARACTVAEALLRGAIKFECPAEGAQAVTSERVVLQIGSPLMYAAQTLLQAVLSAIPDEPSTPAPGLSAARCSAAILPAMHAAASAAKLAHALSSLPPDLRLVQEPWQTCFACETLATAARVAWGLLERVPPASRQEGDVARQAKALVVSVLSPLPLLQQRLERAARGGPAGEGPAGRGPPPPQQAGEMSELALNDVLEVAIAALRPCALRLGDPLGVEEELAGLVLVGGGGRAVEAAIRMGMGLGLRTAKMAEDYNTFLATVSNWLGRAPYSEARCKLCAHLASSGVLGQAVDWILPQAAARSATVGTLGHAVYELVSWVAQGMVRAASELLEILPWCSEGGQSEACAGVAMVHMVQQLRAAENAVQEHGTAVLSSPAFWRQLRSAGGVLGATLRMARMVTAAWEQQQQGDKAEVQVALAAAARACAHLACPNMRGSSEARFAGSQCSRCKTKYCGRACQRAD